MKPRLAVAVLLLGVLVPTAACDGEPSRDAPGPVAGTGARSSPAAGCVDRVMARMSARQRVGQLFMTAVSTSGITRAQTSALRTHQVGSVILVSHSRAGVEHIRAVTRRVRSMAPSVAGTRVGLLTAADQEGGQVQVLKGPGFSDIPSAVTQGRWPASRLQRHAADWGRQLRAAGVQVDLAPVADVVPGGTAAGNPPIGRYARQYGDDPATVARQSGAFIRGLAQARVQSAVKHFPGLGRVRDNTDFSADVTDHVTGRTDPYLAPFRSGVQAGARFVMVSLATYALIDPGHRAVFSSVVLREMIRGTLGFDGVIISDDLGRATAVRAVPPRQRAVGFLESGGDLVLTVDPATVAPMTGAVLSRLRADASWRDRVDSSVRRVLTVKQDAGLLRCPR